ncbi:MAG: hypothetical protein COB81_06385 [Flavobacteriaceae bacterium]|nr:MAG: hypothetical protein COB81_06385 [Flavobacteriaceae bacterium]
MKKIVLLFLVLSGLHSFAQSELAGVSYSFLGGNKDVLDINSTQAWFTIPTKLKNNNFLLHKISYKQLNFSFPGTSFFVVDDLEKFHEFKYGITYIKPLKNSWLLSVNAQPTISSNLKSTLSMDDFNFTGAVGLTKRFKSQKSSLSFGLSYSNRLGIPAPLPYFLYHRTINQNFNYAIGFPVSKFNYNISPKTEVNIQFALDGYYGNISSPLKLSNGKDKFNYKDKEYLIKNINKMSISMNTMALGISHKIHDNWYLNLKTGYIVSNNVSLRNQNEELFSYDLGNKIYASIGIVLKRNKRKK